MGYRYVKWTDAVSDWFHDIGAKLNLNRETWVHIGTEAGGY